jgi:hypothetical protein
MTDISATCEANSDQLNADDLIGGPITVTIAGVRGVSGEQPIAIDLTKHKPFFPCKSVRRLMVAVWGKDGQQYVGRSMTLYRDPDVTYGGMKVGGIRISHMSHIDTAQTHVLASSRKKKSAHTVSVLETTAPAFEWAAWFDTAGIDAAQFKAYSDAGHIPPLSQMTPDELAEVQQNPAKYGALVRGE